jgi:hypothetical protein
MLAIQWETSRAHLPRGYRLISTATAALKKNSRYIIFDRLSGMETHHCGVEHEIGEP